MEEIDRLVSFSSNPVLEQHPNLSIFGSVVIVGGQLMKKTDRRASHLDQLVILYPVAVLLVMIFGFWLLGAVGGVLLFIFTLFGYPMIATFDPRDPLRGRQRLLLFEKSSSQMPAIGKILAAIVAGTTKLVGAGVARPAPPEADRRDERRQDPS